MQKNNPIHIFAGEDNKLVKEKAEALEAGFGENIEKEVYFADETEEGVIFSSLNNFSLFGGKKIVKVYQFEKYIKSFAEYISNPSDDVYLILISYKDAKDIETKLKLKDKSRVSLNLFSAKNQNPSVEIFAELSKLGIKLSNQARDYVASNIINSGDVRDLCNILASIDKEVLNVEDVAPYLEGSKNIFAFLDAFFSKNTPSALIEFQRLYEAGESLLSVLYQVHAQAMKIWNIKAMSAKISDTKEIALKLKIHPFVAKKCYAQSRVFEFAELSGIIKRLHLIDVFIKSREDKLHKMFFEKMIIEICA
jgi:DNA polymerase-3 subunit delta